MARKRRKKKRGTVGRPSKLTPEITNQICDLIRGGNYIETAAAFSGISKETIYAWMKGGAKRSSGLMRAFSDAVGKAVAESEARDVMKLDIAANANWQTIAWRLERRFPTRWGRMDRQEISGPNGGPVQTTATVTAIPFAPDHLNSAYKDHLRRQIEAEKKDLTPA